MNNYPIIKIVALGLALAATSSFTQSCSTASIKQQDTVYEQRFVLRQNNKEIGKMDEVEQINKPIVEQGRPVQYELNVQGEPVHMKIHGGVLKDKIYVDGVFRSTEGVIIPEFTGILNFEFTPTSSKESFVIVKIVK